MDLKSSRYGCCYSFSVGEKCSSRQCLAALGTWLKRTRTRKKRGVTAVLSIPAARTRQRVPRRSMTLPLFAEKRVGMQGKGRGTTFDCQRSGLEAIQRQEGRWTLRVSALSRDRMRRRSFQTTHSVSKSGKGHRVLTLASKERRKAAEGELLAEEGWCFRMS